MAEIAPSKLFPALAKRGRRLYIETYETRAGHHSLMSNKGHQSAGLGQAGCCEAVPMQAMATRPREPKGGGGEGTAVITRTKAQTKKPSLYRVLLLNDDYTPMEFVIHVLERFFNKTRDEATQIMLHVHHNGVGECGVFTYEIAETKVTNVMDFARKHSHPLQCVMEKN